MSNKGNPTISIGIEMPDLDSFITKTENKISDLENLSVDFGLADSFKKELNEMKGMMGDLKQTLSSVNNQKLSSATYNKFSKDITKKVEELNERTTVLEKNLSAVVNTISQNASSKLSESIQELQGDMGNLAKTCKNAVEGIAEVRKAAGSNVKINLFNAQKAAAEELLDDLSEIKKAFDSGDNNLEYAYEIKDKDLKRATKEIDELIERHSELEKRTKSISINTSDYDKLQRELAETTIEIIRYADGLQKLGTTDAKKILNRVFNFEFSGEKIKKSLSQVYDSVLGQVDKLYKTLEQQVENAKDAMRELGDIEERKDKSSNIKGYRIPVDVSTKENLEKKLKNLIDAVRPFAEKQHLDIGISLVTEWGTRKNKKMLQEFQDQINKSADEIDVKALQDLHDQIEKSFNDQIVLKIGSNVEVEKKHILKVIGELQSEIKANPLNIDINLSKEKKDELRSTLDKIVDGVTINIKKVKFDKDLSSTQKDRLGLSEKEIDGLFDKLVELQNKLMGLPDSLKDVTRILQTAFNFTSFETLDSIFSDIQKKVQGISGRLQGKNLNDIKEVLEQFKEYQRLGGTKALTDMGGAQNVKKWLSKRQSELEESNKGRNRSEKLGNDFGEGYALGVREAITAVEKAAIEMTEAAINAVASTQDSHSPSKVAEQLGLYWGEGYANGILKGKGAIKNAIRALVDEGKLVLKDLTEDTIETQYSDAVYQDIVNKKVSTKNAQKYQQIIKNNDKEVNAYQKLATEKGLIELFRSLDKSSEQARQIWNIHNESIKKLKSGTLDAEKAVERLTDAFDELNKKKVSPIDNEWIDVNDSDDYRNSIQKRNIASSGKVKEEIKELGDELEKTGDKGKRASEKISNGMQKVSKETSKSKRSVKKNKDVETFNQLIEQSLKGSKAYEAIGENADKLIEEYAEHIRSGEKTVQKAFEEVFNIASKAYDAKLAEPELNKFKQLATEKGLTKIPGILPSDSKGIILDKQAELLEGIKSGALTAAEAVEELAKTFEEVNTKEKEAVNDSKSIEKKEQRIAELRKKLEDYGNELVKIEKKSKGDSKKYNELQEKYLKKNQINPSAINAEIQQLEHEKRLLEEEAEAQAKATEEKKKAAETQAKWLEEMKKKYPDETEKAVDTTSKENLKTKEKEVEVTKKKTKALNEEAEAQKEVNKEKNKESKSNKNNLSSDELLNSKNEVGKTYDEIINKIKIENEEIEKGNLLFKERQVFLDSNNKVIQSDIGEYNQVSSSSPFGLKHGKVLHTHPANQNYGGHASIDDVINWGEMAKYGFINEAELLWRNTKTNIDFSKMTQDGIDAFVENYYHIIQAIVTHFGEEIEPGKYKISDAKNIDDTVNTYIYALTKSVAESLGGNVSSNLDIDKIDNSIFSGIQKLYEQIIELTNSDMSEGLANAKYKQLRLDYRKSLNETPVSTETKSSQETSQFIGKTKEELEECLKTEEKWLSRCKEGSEKYKQRQQNIEEINSLLKQEETLTGVSDDELKAQEKNFGDIQDSASKTVDVLKTEQPVIEEITNEFKDGAKAADEMAEAVKKFENPLSGHAFKGLFALSEGKDVAKKSDASQILEQIGKYQETGNVDILKEVKKFSDKSSLSNKMKFAIRKSLNETMEQLRKSATDTVKQEVPKHTKKVEMTKSQYMNYVKEKGIIADNDMFQHNFDTKLKALEKRGEAWQNVSKNGRKGKWVIQVEVEDNFEKSTEKAKEFNDTVKKVEDDGRIDVPVADLEQQEKIFGDIVDNAAQTTKVLQDESDVIKEMSSDSKTLDDRFDNMRKAVESFNSFNLSKTKDKNALQQFVGRYINYRNQGGTRDITELTSDTKAQEKLLKAYNLRINAQKDLNDAKKETINQSQKDISNQQEFIDVIDKGTDKLNEQKKVQKELNSTKSKGSTQQKSNEDFIDVNSKVVKSADQTNKSVKKAADAIKEEGKAAKISAKQKEEFAKANKKVAESADKTASSTEKAAEGVSKEGKASKGYDLKAAKEQAKKVYKEIDKQLNQFESDGYITRVDKAYDSHNLLAQALITAEKRIEDESGKLIKETQKLNVKYNKNQRVAYTSQMTSDDYKFNDKLAIQDGKVGANVQAAYTQFLKTKKEIEENIELSKEFGQRVQELDKYFHETGNEAGALQYIKTQYSDLKDNVKQFKAEQEKAVKAEKDALKAAEATVEAQKRSYQKKQQESAKKSEEKQKEDIKEINKLLDEQADAYKKIITTQKEIDLLDKSKDNEKAELEKIKRENQKKYLKSKKSLGTYDQDLVNQLKSKDRLSSIRSDVESKYALKNATKIDSENLNKVNNAYGRILKNLREIDSLQGKVINGVSDKDNTSSVESAQRRIAELRAQNNEAAREIVALDAKDVEKNQEVLEQVRKINFTREQLTENSKSTDVGKINTWAKKLEELANSGKYTEKFTEELREAAQEFREVAKAADSVDLDKLNKQTQELGERFNDLNGAKALKDMQVAAESSLEKLRNKIARITEENTAMGRKFKQQFDNLEIRLHGADLSKAEVEKITAEIFRLDTQLERTNNTGKSFFDMFTTRLKGMNATFFARYFSFYDIVRYARQAFDILRDLDTQLVDLRKTTSMNNTELEKFYKNSTNVGKALGVSSSEIISQASAWSRLGYSTGEAATKMAELSSQFTSISPGMDTEKATDGLVSAMKGFGIAVDDVERSIMDNINKIGKNFAEMYGNIQNYLLVR